jgi:glycosyltransferase involved in cell wall biosynthesis
VRILLLNDVAVPVGGAELHTLLLRDGLRARGHEVRLFASSAFANGAVEADYLCFGTTSGARTAVRTVNPSAYARLRGAIREFDPDVVHVRMFLTQLSPLILPALARRASVYHATWYEAICPTGHKLLPDGTVCTEPAGRACRRNGCLSRRAWTALMLQRAAVRRWLGVFDAVVANSATVARALETDGIRPVEVVHNGVPAAAARDPLADPPLVLFAGRLEREKGVDVLVRAFARALADVPTARLLIAGDGRERPALEGLVAELGVGHAVELAGHLARAELERRAATAWVQAVPSIWNEPFGNVVTEAMARGTAVIASDAGGPAEIVRDGETGALVPPGDVEGLAAAIVRVAGDRELADRLGAEGRRVARREFGVDAWAGRFESIYSRVLEAA